MAVFDRASITRAYDRWAPVYDFVFGKVFATGRAASIAAAESVGGRILEVGVGTGISLERYSRNNRITGIDISAPMLRKAQERVHALGLTHVDALSVMDAAKLAFPDASFDVVVAQYVITAVPDPDGTLDEFARVVRPGGEIVITTRLGAGKGLRGGIEKALMPVTSKLGWRTEFPWERYEAWATVNGRVELAENRPLPPLGHFSLVRYRKKPA
jgi:phosphatidylethanolamine/phosphatidyl-N-methylethanolamine N-methyltransferase